MIARILEAFFRHKFLLVLPPVLMLLVVGPYALLSAPSYYETWAGIWVDRPTYLSYATDWNPYISPSQNQSARLSELLRTRAFVAEVAKRVPSLAPLVSSVEGERRIQELVSRDFGMVTNGNSLLLLRFRASTPQLSYQLVTAVIDAFNDKVATDRISQGDLAISFYESRLKDAQAKLTQSNDTLRRYVSNNPRAQDMLQGSGEGIVPTAVVDPRLADLMGSIQGNQRDVEQLRASLEAARRDISASLEGQELGFQVIDPPRVPTAPTREVRKVLVLPIAAFAAGLAFSAMLLVLLVATDRSARSAADLGMTARVVGVVPRLAVPKLTLKKLPKAARRDAARRAIGFVAGSALPPAQGAKQ